MRRTISVSLLVILALAGCGGGSSFSSAKQAATAVGCDGVEESEVFGSDDAVRCDLGGDSVRIAHFDSGSEMDSYRQIADAAEDSGLTEGEILYGENIAIECNESCDDVREAIDVE
ncbi:hypothetical protein [Aeromicrobium sp. Sec7.5]|uniref:hypothetical protein n=1 Tax=Aeromicrobium sp. Sec7.5 TaxID=3121276 RepID=UPI002FE4ADF1